MVTGEILFMCFIVWKAQMAILTLTTNPVCEQYSAVAGFVQLPFASQVLSATLSMDLS